ncbi:MAG: CHAT domain-containing protein [Pleurocapsa sp. MO_192.B19]|nr:CHAT domain-containing protein [Pleurocapsa sp. MO_192.B19]
MFATIPDYDKALINSRWFKRWTSWFLLAIFICLSISTTAPLKAENSAPQFPIELKNRDERALSLMEQGRILYEAEKYTEAIQTLELALRKYRARKDNLKQAMVLNNLALAYQQLGKYALAEDNLIASLRIISKLPSSSEQKALLAQAQDIKGKLELLKGKADTAYNSWQQAGINYNLIGNQSAAIRSLINQAQALQVLGFYRRGIQTLTTVQTELQEQPETITNAVLWRSLGNATLSTGDLEQAKVNLEKSLAIAIKFDSRENISAAFFSLGNLARSQQKSAQAISNYQQAIKTATSPLQEVQARLNLLNVLIASHRNYQTELKAIEPLIAKLPLNRTLIYSKINYAQILLKIGIHNSKIEPLLQTAIAEAQKLEDKSAEAYGLKSLGRLYEIRKQWQPAQQTNQQALMIAQEINARDIAYQIQWQLGRLFAIQQQEDKAIAAYQQAVENLQSLRSDLVAVNPEVQFTFRESIEPIYREYVSLLLKSPTTKKANLIAARNAIDSLQLAELENFFRATCLDAQPVVIDQITDEQDPTAAFIYPILLEDRWEIILKLPQKPLWHYTTPIDNPQRTARILQRLTQTLTQRNSRETLPWAQQVYSWIIEPAAADLAASQIKTLVFVLDSSLRNIPMSVLHDGQHYLIEKYAVAITPGLQLIQPKAIAQQQLKALTAGLTTARFGFPPLEYVTQELNTIQSQVDKTEQLLDRNFTRTALQEKIAQIPFPIVHLATHGQFSSQAKDTFILTWDERINVNQLNDLLRNSELSNEEAIELLVLSACETLTGDKRAALGLAGVAIKAGARSTLATLWRVNDEATSLLMAQFYQELAKQNKTVTKAEAIRQAQLTLLKSDRFNRPYFWASYVLLGNWL